MTFISRNRIFRIGSHTSQAERWISEGAALSAVVYRCTSLGTRASGPPVRRMVGTDWEAISAVMVRETLAGKVCVSAMGWNRVATVSALVLRSTPGRSHLSPCPLPLPRGERKGACGARGERHSPNPSRSASGAARSAEGTDRGTERWPPNAVAA